MLQSPPKGATIPYRPKPPVAGPVILAGGQAYTIQGNYAVPTHGDVTSPCLPLGPLYPPAGLCDPLLKNGHLQATLPPQHLAAAVEVSCPLTSPPLCLSLYLLSNSFSPFCSHPCHSPLSLPLFRKSDTI